MTAAAYRLCHVTLDGSFSSRNAHLERERAIAVYDLLEENAFIPVGHDGGPYRLSLALAGARLALHISTEAGAHVMSHYLSLAPYRRLLKDYILTCESFYDAIPHASAARFEAIDIGRRAIHNDAAELLRQRLGGKVTVDSDTARRLFTLIYVLLMRRPSIALSNDENEGLGSRRKLAPGRGLITREHSG
ncbi:UPF0262 family protein [Sinorhizobium saheli]|uniref:Uncharacterized protein n=1 Tax=Sinorhizobium saheli TaxID=36856 RepID=A0A178XWP3_SINSA|nr:UPF0262 family protein [Sinorhizobium saheli]MQW86359.1 UPF0262 family protein [Sinorhizobium saheli]OAP39661.1 hypothetical protein ATB98_04910 [Sinorhizobium saheli]